MPPFDEFAPQVIASKILDGIRPDRPQGAQELGLTNSLWEMTVRCWHPDPTQRPNTKEMVNLLRKLLMSSLSMEAHLHSFFEVCKSRGRDGQQEKAQEFADELDEVRHTERHNANSSHRGSRHSKTRVFSRRNGSNI